MGPVAVFAIAGCVLVALVVAVRRSFTHSVGQLLEEHADAYAEVAAMAKRVGGTHTTRYGGIYAETRFELEGVPCTVTISGAQSEDGPLGLKQVLSLSLKGLGAERFEAAWEGCCAHPKRPNDARPRLSWDAVHSDRVTLQGTSASLLEAFAGVLPEAELQALFGSGGEETHAIAIRPGLAEVHVELGMATARLLARAEALIAFLRSGPNRA